MVEHIFVNFSVNFRDDSESISQEQASRWLRICSGFPKGTMLLQTSKSPRYLTHTKQSQNSMLMSQESFSFDESFTY